MFKSLCALLILMLLSGVVVSAQSPETQRAVLNDLNRRTGQTLEFNFFSSWNWSFGTYNYVINQGGCAAAPAAAPTTGDWQRYNITYQGLTYNYIVADNAQSVILCNEASLVVTVAVPTIAPLPTLTPSPVATASNQSSTVCELPPRLEIGEYARVSPGDPNWLHDEWLRSSEKIGEIPANAYAYVMRGPICDAQSGMNFWFVTYENLTGWTSEGLDGEYWLYPAGGRPVIMDTNVDLLAEHSLEAAIAERHPDGITAMIFTPNGWNLVTGDSSGAVQVWYISNNAPSDTVEHPGGVASMAFNSDGSLLATGGLENTIYIWQPSPRPLTEVARIVTGSKVNALAFGSNQMLAAVNADGSVSVWNVTTTPPQLILTLPSKGLIDSLEFSPDGTLLIGRSSASGLVRVWGIPSD
jgi:hypothetical protein